MIEPTAAGSHATADEPPRLHARPDGIRKRLRLVAAVLVLLTVVVGGQWSWRTGHTSFRLLENGQAVSNATVFVTDPPHQPSGRFAQILDELWRLLGLRGRLEGVTSSDDGIVRLPWRNPVLGERDMLLIVDDHKTAPFAMLFRFDPHLTELNLLGESDYQSKSVVTFFGVEVESKSQRRMSVQNRTPFPLHPQ